MKIKARMTKIMAWIQAKKGYCIGAAALIVLLAVLIPNLNIETVSQHNARKQDETKKRQELLEKLEETEVSDVNDSLTPVSEEALNRDAQAVVSGSGMTAEVKEDVNISSGSGLGKEAGQTDTASFAASGSTQTENQNPVQDEQTGSQNTSLKDNSGQNTAGESQERNDHTDSVQGGNQKPSASMGSSNTSQAGSSDASGNTDSSVKEDAYFIVTVKITCENVMGNPDLATSAALPENGILLETKTAVKTGETVFDVLKAVCADNDIACHYTGSVSSAYIASIGGLSEKECGRYSGWKYKVNGVVSGKGCSTYKLSANDVVEWYYATSIDQ